MKNTSIVGMAVLAATLTAGGLVPARAQGAPSGGADLVEASVPVGDLDLASPSGQARARQRLALAVHRACDDDDADDAAAASCRSDALTEAREQLRRLTLRAREVRIQLAAR